MALRIGWRALTFAGSAGQRADASTRPDPHHRTPRAGNVLRHPAQRGPGDPDSGRFAAVRAGPPRHAGARRRDRAEWLERQPAFGTGARAPASGRSSSCELPEGYGMLLLTDGCSRATPAAGDERLGEQGLLTTGRVPSHTLPGREFVGCPHRARRNPGTTSTAGSPTISP